MTPCVHFDFMRQRVQPFHRGLEFNILPSVCEVAAVEEHVAVGDGELVVMGVADADEARPGFRVGDGRELVVLDVDVNVWFFEDDGAIG